MVGRPFEFTGYADAGAVQPVTIAVSFVLVYLTSRWQINTTTRPLFLVELLLSCILQWAQHRFLGTPM